MSRRVLAWRFSTIVVALALWGCNDVGDTTWGTGNPDNGSTADSSAEGAPAGEGADGGEGGASPQDGAAGGATGGGGALPDAGAAETGAAAETGGTGGEPEMEAGRPEAAQPEASGPETGAGFDATVDATVEDATTGTQDASPQDASSGDADATVEASAGDDAEADSTIVEAAADAQDGGSDAQDATADAAGDVAAESGGGADASEAAGGLVPCTTAGQTGCVPCSGSTGGICSATEAIFVQMDIDAGTASADGGGNGCYQCLLQFSCLDWPAHHVTDRECEDLGGVTFSAGNGTSGDSTTLCLDTMSCVAGATGQSCALDTNGPTFCYCGTGGFGTGSNAGPTY